MKHPFARWWHRFRRWFAGPIALDHAFLCVDHATAMIHDGPCEAHHGLPLGILLDSYNEQILVAHRSVQRHREQRVRLFTLGTLNGHARPGEE